MKVLWRLCAAIGATVLIAAGALLMLAGVTHLREPSPMTVGPTDTTETITVLSPEARRARKLAHQRTSPASRSND